MLLPRWLVLSDCVERLLLQYDALKAHFEVAHLKERCYTAKSLSEMFKDERNHLTLLFLHPVLKELNRVNKLFQSNNADNLKIYKELQTFFCALATQILKPAILKGKSADELALLKIDGDFCLLPFDAADLGSSFLSRLEKSVLDQQKKVELKMTAFHFLKELFLSLQKRLSGTFALMKTIESFAFPQFLESPFCTRNFVAPFFDQNAVTLSEIEMKFRQMKLIGWKSTTTADFWSEVHNYTDASGDRSFRTISRGAIKILTLPISNAEVERGFSQVSVVKTKKRNKMKTELLEAILTIKFGLRRMGITTASFDPPTSLLSFNANIY